MADQGTEQRKLAAIMFTDMVGYPDGSGARRVILTRAGRPFDT